MYGVMDKWLILALFQQKLFKYGSLISLVFIGVHTFHLDSFVSWLYLESSNMDILIASKMYTYLQLKYFQILYIVLV